MSESPSGWALTAKHTAGALNYCGHDSILSHYHVTVARASDFMIPRPPPTVTYRDFPPEVQPFSPTVTQDLVHLVHHHDIPAFFIVKVAIMFASLGAASCEGKQCCCLQTKVRK